MCHRQGDLRWVVDGTRETKKRASLSQLLNTLSMLPRCLKGTSKFLGSRCWKKTPTEPAMEMPVTVKKYTECKLNRESYEGYYKCFSNISFSLTNHLDFTMV